MNTSYWVQMIFLLLGFPIFRVQTASAQSPWDRMSITGREAKFITHRARLRWVLTVSQNFPFGKLPDQETQKGSLQEATLAPGVREQLLENLNGEWTVGGFGTQIDTAYGLPGKYRLFPALHAGINWDQRLEFKTGVQYFRAGWDGKFPTAVASFSSPNQFQTIYGAASVSSKYLIFDSEIALYAFRKGWFRPFVQTGIHYSRLLQQETKASLATVDLPFHLPQKRTVISTFGGLGNRYIITNRFIIEMALNYGRFLYFRPGFTGRLAIGYRW